MSRIPDFETKSFIVPGEQIEQWNEGMLPLPKETGYRGMAPEDLLVIIKFRFFFDGQYEIGELSYPDDDSLVFHDAWRGRETQLLPYCKELLEINERLKQYGWTIPDRWSPSLFEASEPYLRKKLRGYLWDGFSEFEDRVGAWWSLEPIDVICWDDGNNCRRDKEGCPSTGACGHMLDWSEHYKRSHARCCCIKSSSPLPLEAWMKTRNHRTLGLSVRCVAR